MKIKSVELWADLKGYGFCLVINSEGCKNPDFDGKIDFDGNREIRHYRIGLNSEGEREIAPGYRVKNVFEEYEQRYCLRVRDGEYPLIVIDD